MFLQPFILLWGLPLVAIPVLIHFLNRLRYRTVKWAAMQFLLAATRSSSRHARIRQWLLLALRMLAVLGLVIALARPQVGGWLGLAFGGPPDVVILLLDRSASMELTDPRNHESLREQAARVFTDTGGALGSGTTFVLIDSLDRKPAVLGSVADLPNLPQVRGTAAAANIPAMLEAATRYLLDHPAARPEIWLASDLQASNWQPDDPLWSSLQGQLAALPSAPRIRVLEIESDTSANTALQLDSARRRRNQGKDELQLTMTVLNPNLINRRIPLQFELNGHPLPMEIDLEGPNLVVQHSVPLDGEPESGWGRVSLPADDNPLDNSLWFGYAPSVAGRTLVVSDLEPTSTILTIAAAPAPQAMNQSASAIKPEAFPAAVLNDCSLILWQAPLPTGPAADHLTEYVQAGGVVLLLPPGSEAGETTIFDGLRWTAKELADTEEGYKLGTWEEETGPLARTAAGERLPLDLLQIRLRHRYQATGADILASFADGAPLLSRLRLGAGQVLMLASLPQPDWSNLAEAPVLLPLVQRLLAIGQARLGGVRYNEVGSMSADDVNAEWTALDKAAETPLLEGGIWRTATGVVALNRATVEDLTGRLDGDNALALFGALDVRLSLERGGARDAGHSEVTFAVLLAALLALIIESYLTLPSRATEPTGDTRLG